MGKKNTNKETNKNIDKIEYRDGYKRISNTSNGSYFLDKNGNVKFSTKHTNNC